MRHRAVTRSALGWGFGMAVSVLLLALWGRSVVADTETLAESLSPLARSGVVIDLVADWMTDEMIESGGDPAVVEPTVDHYFQTSSVGGTLEQLGDEVVRAAASTDPGGSTIDMAALVGPAVPELTLGLADLGFGVSEGQVSEVVEGLDPLVIRQPGAEALVGPASPTAARLGTAAFLALLAILGFGGGYVALSGDRIGAVRDLLNRIALGGLGFAVFLRLGAWVLDPRGGRAPVPETLSALAISKWAVPLQVALVAGLIGAGIYVSRRLLKRRGGFRSADELPTPPPVPTGWRSGSR